MPKALSAARKEHSKTPKKATEKTVKGTKKKSAPRDPKAPKRPLSAFMFFCKDWRERIKAENPDASFADQGKLLGAKWKELEEEDKKTYSKEAANDKQRYETQMAEYKKKPADGSGSGGDAEEGDEE